MIKYIKTKLKLYIQSEIIKYLKSLEVVSKGKVYAKKKEVYKDDEIEENIFYQ